MVCKRAVIVLVGLAGGCAAAPGRGRESSAGDATGVLVTVRNRSGSDITELVLRSSARRSWGPERLGGQPLHAGQNRALRLDGCAPREVRLRGVHGEECVLASVGVCAENDGFTLTRDDLERCAAWR